MTTTSATTPSPALTPAAGAAAQFLAVFRREHATTAKVLRAFPPEQAELRPHERSSTARRLAWTFVIEQRFMLAALRKESVLAVGGQPEPDSWQAILDAFEVDFAEVVRMLEAQPDAFVGTVQFFVGPKQPGEYSTGDFVWFMLLDQIHHRGQFSVYLRMAGGKVPSIYGPSADEPWN